MPNKPEPDSDSINMFIGQLPRHFDEEELENFLLQYGPIYEVKIMKEKSSGHSKGCGFVTFYTRNDALKAQMALHNLKIFPGMSNPVQMKPADIQTNTVEHRRIFVGMLGKNMTEEEVTALFKPYGTVEDCNLVKETEFNSYNKGYGFVIMSSKSEAENAVKNLNNSITFEGAKSPLIVRIAYTNRDKEKKSSYNPPHRNHSDFHRDFHNDFHNDGPISAKRPRLDQEQFTSPSNNIIGNGMPIFPQQDINFNPNTLIPTNQAELQKLLIAAVTTSPLLQTNPIGMAMLIGSIGIGQNINLNQSDCQNVNQTGMNQLFNQMPVNVQNNSMFMQNNSNNQFDKQQMNSTAVKGPDGCNLVVHKLPRECNNDKLRQIFSPFGNILSANVFYDKSTGFSKCYGFVSYDNKQAALNAIHGMNNFQINDTRLKVSLKTERNWSH